LVESIYLAGIVDGEGCIGVSECGSVYFSIANTCEALIDWICATFGAAKTRVKRDNVKHKNGYLARFDVDTAERVLQQIEPFLRVKKRQAKLALAVLAAKKTMNYSRDKVYKAWLSEIAGLCHSLNKRGK
jgi:hypothetical protein